MDEQAEGEWGGDNVGLKVETGEMISEAPSAACQGTLDKCPLLFHSESLPVRGPGQRVGGDLAILVLFDCTSTKPPLSQHLRVFFFFFM